MEQYAGIGSRNLANIRDLVDRYKISGPQSDTGDKPFIYIPAIQHLFVQSQQQKH